MKKITVALVGQPNVGKSMLINSIADAHLHVGNFSGVTVEKAEVFLKYKDYEIRMVDLPGTYALSEYSLEEKVTTSFINKGEYDLVVNVVDSTDLNKNFHLTAELMSKNKKMILALNMMDEAEKEGIEIDDKQLTVLTNIHCVKVSAAKHQGVDTLVEKIVEVFESEYSAPKITFSKTLEEQIDHLKSVIGEHSSNEELTDRGFLIDLLKGDRSAYEKMKNDPVFMEVESEIKNAIDQIELFNKTKDIKEAFTIEYEAFIRGLLKKVVSYKNTKEKKITTDSLDNVLIHAIFGIPIFLFLMWGLFQLAFSVGNIGNDAINDWFGWLGTQVALYVPTEFLKSLIGDGIIPGVGAVIGFTPNIIILFAGIALLETTGYMARVSFLLDGVFRRFGLHGQSFIPLITGFGCSIPAYMATRILKNRSDRLLTLFTISFMSCGARLPIYMVMTGAIFSPGMQGNALFAIYIGGAFLGLIMAKVLKMTAFKGIEEPFVMEMPKYRLPALKLIWYTVYMKTWMFVKKAGTFIAGASVLVWFLSSYPQDQQILDEYQTKIEQAATSDAKMTLENQRDEALLGQSYLGMIGKFFEPVMQPIGLDWKMTVALQAGLAAKEVVVSTLGILYSLGSVDADGDTSNLVEKIRQAVPFASGVAFIVVVMIYLPCLAATSVFYRETGHYKYVIYQLVYTSVLAYVVAFIAYRIALNFS